MDGETDGWRKGRFDTSQRDKMAERMKNDKKVRIYSYVQKNKINARNDGQMDLFINE